MRNWFSSNHTIYAVAFLNSVSYAAIIPLLPFLILDVGGDPLVGGALIATHALASVVTAPVFGLLSDRYGRKPLLVLSLLGTAISYCLLAIADTLLLIFVSRLLAGAMSGNMGVVQAAAVDDAPLNGHGKAISLIAAAYAAGYVVGPALAGSASIVEPDRVMMLVGFSAATVSFATALILGIIYAPGANTARPVYTKLGPKVNKSRQLRENLSSAVVKMLLVLTILSLCQSGMTSMVGFWAHYMFGWSESGTSLLMLVAGTSVVFVQAVLLPFLFKTMKYKIVLIVACFICGIGCAVLAFGSPNLFLTLVSLSFVFAAVTASISVITTLLSGEVPENRRGEVLSLGTSAGGIGRIVGPIIFGGTFALINPGAIFLMVGAVMFGGAAWYSIQQRIGDSTKV